MAGECLARVHHESSFVGPRFEFFNCYNPLSGENHEEIWKKKGSKMPKGWKVVAVCNDTIVLPTESEGVHYSPPTNAELFVLKIVAGIVGSLVLVYCSSVIAAKCLRWGRKVDMKANPMVPIQRLSLDHNSTSRQPLLLPPSPHIGFCHPNSSPLIKTVFLEDCVEAERWTRVCRQTSEGSCCCLTHRRRASWSIPNSISNAA